MNRGSHVQFLKQTFCRKYQKLMGAFHFSKLGDVTRQLWSQMGVGGGGGGAPV